MKHSIKEYAEMAVRYQKKAKCQGRNVNDGAAVRHVFSYRHIFNPPLFQKVLEKVREIKDAGVTESQEKRDLQPASNGNKLWYQSGQYE